ncbi:MAG TPA: DUF1080 domain-containing protein [Chitinophaga sp.]|uniref:3-keto-disaccharide hydrolase n=1 Tax=Chitinophaga sp. TaxID=1869181 RepID=UPI002C8AAA13|nr:DUF1080 domain-containing protein [Chitinophaga sp.]HVI45341.1 DUF1080 domain-containing protein [Chitinophaga sp.]
MIQKSRDQFLSRSWIGILCVCSAGFLPGLHAAGQSIPVDLQDFSAFRKAGSSWRIAGEVSTLPDKPNTFNFSKGTGILVNQPDQKNPGQDLYTSMEHGDLDLELDYMMAAGSNSGIYFQGRYELQLLDSWGVRSPRPGDNGGIYERWDDSKPEGQKGYQGYAPRQNASKAPGLWQHLKVIFQAPRFDATGQKTENARILRAELNGVLIHENVELQGPTRGSIGDGNEKATGPLRIQGDHGAVAFRNIQFREYSKPRPTLDNLQFVEFKGRYQPSADYTAMQPESKGRTTSLTANAGALSREYVLIYKGNLTVKEAGEYTFEMNAQGGQGMMKINNTIAVQPGNNNPKGKITLPTGSLPVEIMYSRSGDRGTPALGLNITGPGIRTFYTGDPVISAATDPILVDAASNTILRSFIDLPGEKKVVHAVSVGSPENVHYTYDLDKGAIVQVWRGNFLETTPMWHDRGDGTARPLGALQRLGKPLLTLCRLAAPQAAWSTDTTGSGYRPKGYILDENDRPTFRYLAYGSTVTDVIRVLEDGHGLLREINVTAPGNDLYARIAEGTRITLLEKDIYVIDDKAWYLQLKDTGDAKPVIRNAGDNHQELIVPVRSKLSYVILF